MTYSGVDRHKSAILTRRSFRIWNQTRHNLLQAIHLAP